MDKFRVWFGFCGEAYVGEDPRCPWQWRGSGCYAMFEDKTILAVADIWCKEENIEDQVLELCKKEFDMDIDALQIIKHAWIGTGEGDDPDEYIDDWHVIREKEGSMKEELTMSDFAKFWDGGKNAHPGDVFFTAEGRLIEIL